MAGILGKKLEMTRVIHNGAFTPVTLISVPTLDVAQVKTVETDGYSAVVIRMTDGKKVTMREFDLDGVLANVVKGDVLSLDIFESITEVAVTGISKGKGFQGGVKRHGFKGGPRSHGQKHSEREPGSVGGGGRDGGRIAKGKRMGGRMGSDRVTVKNLKIVEVDSAARQILVRGAIPGRRGTLVEVRTV